MITAFSKETSYTPEEEVQQEIDENANSEIVDIENEEKEEKPEEKQEAEKKQEPEGPDF
jgi:hypothetical protein